MVHVALFGTSADPPTAGHQAILRWLARTFDQVAVWASDNPFKSHQTPLQHRAAMLQLLIDDIEPPCTNIHYYADLSHPRTLTTVEHARRRWSSAAEFTLVIGADLVSQLPRWYRIDELFEQVSLLVVPRPGYTLQPQDIEQLRRLGARVAIADLSVPNVSSSAYREGGDQAILTAPVEDYIHREQLYACQNAAPNRRQA